MENLNMTLREVPSGRLADKEDLKASALASTIRSIPQQAQQQGSTIEQLVLLRGVANKLGLYDAADLLRNIIETSSKKMR